MEITLRHTSTYRWHATTNSSSSSTSNTNTSKTYDTSMQQI